MSFEPRQEPEHVPGKRLTAIAAVSVAITVLAIVIAWRFVEATTRAPSAYSNAPPPPPLGGFVEHTLINDADRGQAERRAQQAELEAWGWVDRGAGIAHIPIEKAIDEWVARQGASAAPSEPAPPRLRPRMPTRSQEPGAPLGMKPPDWRAH